MLKSLAIVAVDVNVTIVMRVGNLLLSASLVMDPGIFYDISTR